jgi:hypothetical protein
VLGGSIRIVTSPFGGLSLDVDDEEDYRILQERYEDWMAIHEATGVQEQHTGSDS